MPRATIIHLVLRYAKCHVDVRLCCSKGVELKRKYDKYTHTHNVDIGKGKYFASIHLNGSDSNALWDIHTGTYYNNKKDPVTVQTREERSSLDFFIAHEDCLRMFWEREWEITLEVIASDGMRVIREMENLKALESFRKNVFWNFPARDL